MCPLGPTSVTRFGFCHLHPEIHSPPSIDPAVRSAVHGWVSERVSERASEQSKGPFGWAQMLANIGYEIQLAIEGSVSRGSV
jgi:hypothetical protein